MTNLMDREKTVANASKVLGARHVAWFLRQPKAVREGKEWGAWHANLLPEFKAYSALNRVLSQTG